MSRIAITGAAGFLGRALVRGARAKGLEVLALVRNAPDPAWAGDSGITSVAVDLGDPDCLRDIAQALRDVQTVIHAAASVGGDAAAHARDTIAATGHLAEAMTGLPQPPQCVLVSSLSVYDVAALPDNAVLNEESPLVEDAAQRDAYAAAKREQERLVQKTLRDVRIVRPGVIYGPGRLWTAHLGFAKGGLVVCPGGTAAVPALHVDHAAAGILAAANPEMRATTSNLIDPAPPTQAEWLQALGQRFVTVPLGFALTAGRLLGRGPAWSARFRPLQYDTTRSALLLGPGTRPSFQEALAAIRHSGTDPS